MPYKASIIRAILSFLLIIAGIGIGFTGGVLAYWISKLTMPWLTSFQLKLIIPLFSLSGTIMGLIGVVKFLFNI